MKVLVVDDSKVTRGMIGRILREFGFEIVEASNGLEAIEKVQAEQPELTLVDWNMPEMNGYEFIKAIRAEPQYDNMKIMMVTTESDIDQMTAALEAGANEYVMKPFTKDIITEKLAILGVINANA
ncbi:MAG: response regulator [Verrucomicrobiia bacterium]